VKIETWCRHLENCHFLAEKHQTCLKRRWESVFCNNSVQNDKFLVVNEPEEQEFSLKKSNFQQILGSGWRLHGIFSSS
jgi:hypothetical protein